MLGSFVYPVLVEPAFNHFTPLPDGPLRTQILQLADDGARAPRRRARRRRVTAYDDAQRLRVRLRQHPPGRALRQRRPRPARATRSSSIVAHELGHARHDDVLTGSILAALGATLGIGLLGARSCRSCADARARCATRRSCRWSWPWSRSRTLLSSPVNNGLSRLIETRADVDSLQTTRDPAAFIAMQRQLALQLAERPAAGLVAVLVRVAPHDAASGSRSPSSCGRRLGRPCRPAERRAETRWPRTPHGSAAIPCRGDRKVSRCRRSALGADRRCRCR